MEQAGEASNRVERSYYEDGTLKEEIEYRDGARSPNGRWRQWHPNGQLAGEFFLEHNVYVNGTNRFWYPDGRLAMEQTYSRGRIVHHAIFNPDGTPMAGPENSARALMKKAIARGEKAKPRRLRKTADPNALETAAFIEQRLAGRTAPALAWLGEATADAERTLGEMDPKLSVEFVEALSKLGAAEIVAVDIEVALGTDGQTSNHLVIRLPEDSQARARVLGFCSVIAKDQGFDAMIDSGQAWEFLKLC